MGTSVTNCPMSPFFIEYVVAFIAALLMGLIIPCFFLNGGINLFGNKAIPFVKPWFKKQVNDKCA